MYDILHEPGTSLEARLLARIWRRVAPGAPMTALEPACGTGRLLVRLAHAGWKVSGFDADERMVRYARERLRAAGITRPTVWRARFDSFGSRVAPRSIGLAFCPINSIRHVSSDLEMVRHLRLVKRSLAPGGVYAVGISLSVYGLEAPTEDVWTGSRGGVRVKQVVSYTPARRGTGRIGRAEHVNSVLEIRRRGSVEARSSAYTLLSYSRDQWQRAIARSGLRIIGIVNECATDFDPGALGYAIWLLARPEHPLNAVRPVRGSRPNG